MKPDVDKLDLIVEFAQWTKTKPWTGFKYKISNDEFRVWVDTKK